MSFLVALLVAPLVVLAPSAAWSIPMDLQNPNPREVVVQIESSAVVWKLDLQYSTSIAAFLTPNRDGTVQVTISGDDWLAFLENGMGAPMQNVSPYVWTFDPDTNHVLSASMSAQTFAVFGGRPALVPISQNVSTTGGALGYIPTDVGGFELELICIPGMDRGCEAIEKVSYQPDTGYVNALGPMVFGPPLEVAVLSMFGEAIFSENVAYGDINGDGAINVLDTQCLLLAAQAVQLGEPFPACVAPGVPGPDLNCDGGVNVGDINLSISLAIERPFEEVIDMNANQIHDDCE